MRTRASLCTNSLSIPRRSSAAAPVPEHLQVELLRVFLWRKVPRVERRVARAAARERGQVARCGSLEPKVAAHAHLRGMRGWAPRRCVRDGSRRTCTRVSQNANKCPNVKLENHFLSSAVTVRKPGIRTQPREDEKKHGRGEGADLPPRAARFVISVPALAPRHLLREPEALPALRENQVGLLGRGRPAVGGTTRSRPESHNQKEKSTG